MNLSNYESMYKASQLDNGFFIIDGKEGVVQLLARDSIDLK